MTRTPSPVLEITEEIIAAAEKRHSGHCMIAETVKEAVPDSSYISVDLQTIRFTLLKRGERYVYLTPTPAQAALVNFDQGQHTEPFSVRLRGGQATRAGKGKKGDKPPKSKLARAGNSQTRSGGKPPPTAALHTGSGSPKDKITGVGSRRTFGIKNLKL